MKVEIVMPCINLWKKYTQPAVESVLDAMVNARGHQIECHLIIVDNASTDETKTEASNYDHYLVYHQRNDTRWGFQKSVNFGVAYGIEHRADLILVINNDILLHPSAISRLVERFQKGDVGMVTCLDVSHEMRENGIAPQFIGNMSVQEKEKVEEAPHPCFSAFMVSKECWEEIGEFDELFFPAYYEDNDYHYRMNIANVPAIVYPPAMFYHYGSKTQQEGDEHGNPIVSHGAFQNTQAFYKRKWGGLPGHETFQTPFDDPSKTYRDTEQGVIPKENL
jgi:GT2 family glycosyltransferase